ncbi:sodium:solute symporter family transporter [Maribacter polysaccharolyticus]|uniref:sodium:solute symporter family transporter n=1 Tax=Maribacter polysaccharolyticus TaxID=3020831 RepID=UPI00237FC201|nr:sodium:solute symporter [Maribacter polysaccharolyticus]MDE3742522.1 sodium:solute symporter [Maribacter polysaccharolyticus]
MTDSYQVTTLIVLIGFMSILFYMVYKSRVSTDSLEVYAVGNRSFSPLSVALSLAASITSAATFIINPGFIALYGLSAFIAFGVVMPFAIYAALIIFIKRFRKYGMDVKSISIADWVGKRYDSRPLKILFGFLSMLLITFIVLICVGMTKVVSKALDANELTILILIVVVVFTYMMIGGANTMVYTNSVQAILMIIVAVLLLGSGSDILFKSGGEGFLFQLDQIDTSLTATFNEQSPLFRDFFEVVVCNTLVGIAIVCQPHILTKSLLIKKDDQVNRFLLYTVVVLVLFFSVVLVGFYARLSFPDLMFNGAPLKMDGIVSAYVLHRFPVYVGIVVILGLLAAGLSTLEGLIQSIPTTITNDFIVPIGEMAHLKTAPMKINKGVTVIVGILAIVLSYDQLVNPSLSVGIFAQNGVYAFFSAAFVPVFFGIFTKTRNKWIPIAASLVAILTHFGVYYLELTPYMEGMTIKNPAIASALALIASTVTGLTIYVINPMNKNVHAYARP